jgi:UDP-N-acetylglucosamine--N-acetylmuramyl-(pentapeptide) pyrophosphoryl-undecaprenol N-acetylglucosamine transferase
MEAELVQRVGVPFTGIPAAGLHGVGIRTLPGNLVKLIKGYQHARHLLKEFQPDLLFFTGGYIGAPIALAGQNIPSLLFVPDIEPGLALKALGRWTDRIAVTTEETHKYFTHPERIVVTGYPTRPDLQAWDKDSARSHFGIKSNLPVVLIYGGSKGARSINQAALSILPKLLARAEVIHISGKLDWETVKQASQDFPQTISENYHSFDFLHAGEMGAAFASANLAVCRAGASTLGELPLFGLPAILVPYPYAWRYQKVNADYLAGNGAARILRDESLGTELLPAVLSLLDHPRDLEGMSQKMRALAKPAAAERIADLMVEMSSSKEGQYHA